MTLKQQMAADAAIFTNSDEFGEEVAWQPAGADPLEDKVAIQFHQGAMMVKGQMVAIETEGTVLVAITAIPDPAAGANFTRDDGKVWTIDRTGLRGSDTVFHRLACHLDPLPTLKGW